MGMTALPRAQVPLSFYWDQTYIAVNGGTAVPTSALLRKLRIFAELSSEEVALLNDITRDVRTTSTKRDIISEGAKPEHLHLIVQGWAVRYKVLSDGTRQITAFLIPGDLCDLHVTILEQMDHSIAALTTCRVAWVASDLFDRLTAEHPRLTRALWWGTLVDAAVLRAWIVNLGRRDAYARIAHLLCELHYRMSMVGLTHNDRFDFPLTQSELADATGLTPVHVNRTVQSLRADGLIELSAKALKITDVGALQQAAGFDPAYLHIAKRTR